MSLFAEVKEDYNASMKKSMGTRKTKEFPNFGLHTADMVENTKQSINPLILG